MIVRCEPAGTEGVDGSKSERREEPPGGEERVILCRVNAGSGRRRLGDRRPRARTTSWLTIVRIPFRGLARLGGRFGQRLARGHSADLGRGPLPAIEWALATASVRSPFDPAEGHGAGNLAEDEQATIHPLPGGQSIGGPHYDQPRGAEFPHESDRDSARLRQRFRLGQQGIHRHELSRDPDSPAGSGKVKVVLSNSVTYPADVVGMNAGSDLAVLKMTMPGPRA